VNALLGNAAGPVVPAAKPSDVLEQLERGEISAKEAAQLLKGRSS